MDHTTPVLALAPRPTGTPPTCRNCGVVVWDAKRGGALDPFCGACAGANVFGRRPEYAPRLLDWADGVHWGAVAAPTEIPA